MDIRIVILQRGWIFVGVWEQQGDEVSLSNSRNIRRWGTTAGLQQLANDGPTSETVLEVQAKRPNKFHRLSIVSSLECEPALWKKHLGIK